jgi:hypothetical protein
VPVAQAAPAAHSTQLPSLHTWSTPQKVPLGAGVGLAHVPTSPSQTVTPI